MNANLSPVIAVGDAAATLPRFRSLETTTFMVLFPSAGC